MPTRGSLIGLGLSVPPLASLEPRHYPDIVIRQISTPTVQLNASVAPTPSTFLPQSAQTVSLRAVRIRTQSFTNRSPALVTKSLAVDVALVAGSVSVLVGVGGLVGVACYWKKRRGKLNSTAQIKVRKKAHRNKGHPEDLEASYSHSVRGTDVDSESRSSKSMLEINMAKFIEFPGYSNLSSPLSPSTPPAMSFAPILEGAVYSPWNTHTDLAPGLMSPDTIYANSFRDDNSSPHPKSYVPDLEGDEAEGIDVGSVALSSLHMHQGYDVPELYDSNALLRRSDFIFDSKVKKTSDGVLTQPSESHLDEDEEASVVDAHLSQQRNSTVSSSALGEGPSETGAQTGNLTSSPSVLRPERSSDDVHLPAPPLRSIEEPPRLLEVTLLESEIDLRTILGLGKDKTDSVEAVDSSNNIVSAMSTVPGLVATDSQDTVTGTDESCDNSNFVSPMLPQSQSGEFVSLGDLISNQPAQSPRDSQQHRPSRIPLLLKHIVKRTSTLHAGGGIARDISVVSPSVLDLSAQSNSLSYSGSSSSSASSNSVVTLKLPSFSSSPESALLTEEFLPPPSIIVSVPTEGSIRPRDSWEPMYASLQAAVHDTLAAQKSWSAGMEKLREDKMKAIARVVFDPADESDDDAWEEAYARTCFVEVTDSVGEESDMVSFAGSWIVCSESSDLDLEETVARFPLPPDHLGLAVGGIVWGN